MNTPNTLSKKRGPVGGAGQAVATVRTTVMLEPALVEWGKAQPGGLSLLLRRLLTQEQKRKAGQ